MQGNWSGQARSPVLILKTTQTLTFWMGTGFSSPDICLVGEKDQWKSIDLTCVFFLGKRICAAAPAETSYILNTPHKHWRFKRQRDFHFLKGTLRNSKSVGNANSFRQREGAGASEAVYILRINMTSDVRNGNGNFTEGATTMQSSSSPPAAGCGRI